HSGQHVGDRDADLLRAGARLAVALAGDRHQPAHALEDEVVAWAGRVRSVLPEPGDGAIHQAGVLLLEVFITQAVALQRADLVVFDQHRALRRELACDRLSLGLGKVERDRFLVPVHRGVVRSLLRVLARAVLEERRAPTARVVAGSGPLYLDDLGAEVPEVLRGPGPGKDPRQIEDANVRK